MFKEAAEEHIMKKYPFETNGHKNLIIEWENGADYGYDKCKSEVIELLKIGMEGIKNWGIVSADGRPFQKEAENLFFSFYEKADEFINKNNNKKPFEIPHTEAERELNLHNNLVDLGCF